MKTIIFFAATMMLVGCMSEDVPERWPPGLLGACHGNPNPPRYQPAPRIEPPPTRHDVLTDFCPDLDYRVCMERWQFAARENEPAVPDKTVPIYAPQLFGRYGDNEVNADKLYTGNRLAVKGAVYRVGKGNDGKPYVFLYGGKYRLFGVLCAFDDGGEGGIVSLVPGHLVTITGVCEGKRFGYVVVRHCDVVFASDGPVIYRDHLK